MKLNTEEAFVKVLQLHGIRHAFGIIGSAMMPVSDLFGKAGITFWDCAHETNAALICDGYTRSTGKMAMAIAQNGPGVTGFVTAVTTAYWNHTPMLVVTPQAANRTIGQGGFQEIDQMAMFEVSVCYQEEVRDPVRIPEVLNSVIERAWRGSAPAQINVPRDYWTKVIYVELPQIVHPERPAGGEQAVAEAARLLSEARFPVILNGAGVVIGGALTDSATLAERLDAPVACGYQHNDAFPGSHPLAVGPLGYNGSKAAMELVAQADVVLALGTRLNPFSTLPGYGIDYWPKDAKIIQVDINPDRIGLTKKVTVGICGDSGKVARAIHAQLRPPPATPAARSAARRSTGPARLGCSSCPRSTTRRMIPAPAGTRTPAAASPSAFRPARPGGASSRRCRARRSSPPTSATIARSATPTRPSTKAESTSLQACSGHAATASRRSSAPRSATPTRRWSASPATAPSGSR
jgi:sulfoacetaldehyde acetyltransferase